MTFHPIGTMSHRAVYWTCIFWLVVVCTEAFFLPFPKQSTQKTSQYAVLARQRNRNRGRYYKYGWPRRKDTNSQKYRKFSRYLAKQAAKPRYQSQKDFVDDMFSMFDINGDRFIEKSEFRAILQGMGVIPHTL